MLALSVNQVTIFNLITLLVNKPAQQHTTSRIATGHVNPVMLPVRNVQVRTIILALSVNKGTFYNLIKQLVLIPAPRHPTTPIVNSKYVSHVMKPVKFVLARQIILALFVTQRTFSNRITILVLKPAIKATTPIVTAKNVSHVMKPVPSVQVPEETLALLVIQRFICSLTLCIVLQPAIKATTVSLPATHERHVIQLVPNVQVQD